jgi:Zn-dependent protease
LFFVPFLFALCFHEFAHGFVAKLRGDDTAESMGRLTLNPLAHMDPVGTFLLPLGAIIMQSMGMMVPLFGWAKPVPVNPRNLRNARNDMFWVALAGPASNILLFVAGLVAFALLLKFEILQQSSGLQQMLVMFLYINVFLAIFNLLPIHPLDGGKILERFIPYSWNSWLENNQYQLNLILFGLILFGAMRFLLYPADLLVKSSLYWIEVGVH